MPGNVCFRQHGRRSLQSGRPAQTAQPHVNNIGNAVFPRAQRRRVLNQERGCPLNHMLGNG
eukprot:3651974-Lingulodinium_polyedra.AAC.1